MKYEVHIAYEMSENVYKMRYFNAYGCKLFAQSIAQDLAFEYLKKGYQVHLKIENYENKKVIYIIEVRDWYKYEVRN